MLFLPPEVDDLAKSVHAMSENHANSADFYRGLVKVSTWEGSAAATAKDSILAAANHHDATAADLKTAASSMDRCETESQKVSNMARSLLNFAAQVPQVEVNMDTNAVVPPDLSLYTPEVAQKLSEKVADLEAQIADTVVASDVVDSDLAKAMSLISGVPVHPIPQAPPPALPPLAPGQSRNLGPVAGTGAVPGIPGIGAADLGEPVQLPDGHWVQIFGDSFRDPKVGGPDNPHFPSVAVPVTFDKQGRPHYGLPLTGPDGKGNLLFPLPKNDQLPMDKLPKGFDINNYKYTLPAGSFQANGKSYMMVVATDGHLQPIGGSWMVEVNNDPAKGWQMIPGSYRAWDSVPAPTKDEPWRVRGVDGNMPSQISAYQGSDGKVHIAADSFDRSRGVTMYQVDNPADASDRSKWRPLLGDGTYGQAGQQATSQVSQNNFGELSFREVQGKPVLSGFNAGTFSTEVRVGDDPNQIFDSPKTVVAPGGLWKDHIPGQYPQNYGGYLMPGSTLDNLNILISQWNTDTNDVYTVEQFQVHPNR